MIARYALALAVTIIVEGCIAAAVLRRFYWLETTAIQLVTWPVAAILAARHFWLVETGVAVVETLLWALVVPIGWRKAALVSFAANAATALIGYTHAFGTNSFS
jgi:uncharacterized membrane protein YoaK (UPF0700 family)